MSDDKMKTGRREVLFGIGAATALVTVGGVPKAEAQAATGGILSADELEAERARRLEENERLSPFGKRLPQEIELCVYREVGDSPFFEPASLHDVREGTKFETWCGVKHLKDPSMDHLYVGLGYALRTFVPNRNNLIGSERYSGHVNSWSLQHDEHGRRVQAGLVGSEESGFKMEPYEVTDSRVCRACAAAILKQLQERVFIG